MVIIKKDYGIKDKEFSLFFIDVITKIYFFLCDLKFKKIDNFQGPQRTNWFDPVYLSYL